MKTTFSMIVLSFNYIIPFVILGVLFLKVALFFKFRTNKCKLSNLVYFDSRQIVSSKSMDRVNLKIIQNSLTYYLVFLVAVSLLLHLL